MSADGSTLSPPSSRTEGVAIEDFQFLEARATVYDLLARLYTYPLDEAALDAVAALSVEDAPDEVAEALDVMQARIAAAPERAPFVEALNIESTRLFEGPGQPATPPYASFYLNEGRLMGSAALAARRAYLAWNARPRDDGRVPPDHLALELGFMAHLAHAAAGASDGEAARSHSDSAEFLDEHLLTWVPRFGDEVARATSHPFFVGLANLTTAILEADEAWLREALADLGISDQVKVTRRASTLEGDGDEEA